MRSAAMLFLTPFLIIGQLGTAQAPLSYECLHARVPPKIDGNLDDAVWRAAKWSNDFIDITGDPAKAPRFRTRMKLLWDDHYLYIAAELQEPDVHGRLTQHDSVIFHDDDFELFLKPDTSAEGYFEFEINALNATWDLYLDKPYRMGGKADNGWEPSGVKTAVAVQGTLNRSDDRDTGWTVEIAMPLDGFASRQKISMPRDGTVWRANFSRVEWLTGHPREENWVWSSQGEVNMHIPEKWGYLTFRR